MTKIKEQRVTIKKYGGNLIQVGIWQLLGRKKGELSYEDVKSQILIELDITPRQLTTYLENISQPKIEEFFKIAQILECTVNDLITEKK